jgi:hypothetical protein
MGEVFRDAPAQLCASRSLVRQGKKRASVLALIVALLLPAPTLAAPPKPVLWAWERPEDLRFAGDRVEVAAMTGFVVLSGDQVWARGRRFVLRTAPGVRRAAMVHVQIDPKHALVWSRALRERAAAAILAYARAPGFDAVQVDFEVAASQHQVLLDVMADVRAGLPPGTSLSMTALASWCDTENWLDGVDVDEIVPMLFRMGPRGEALKARLAQGGDFADRRCRTAVGVATDSLPGGLPAGRRLYLFDPKSWSAADYDAAIRKLGS